MGPALREVQLLWQAAGRRLQRVRSLGPSYTLPPEEEAQALMDRLRGLTKSQVASEDREGPHLGGSLFPHEVIYTPSGTLPLPLRGTLGGGVVHGDAGTPPSDTTGGRGRGRCSGVANAASASGTPDDHQYLPPPPLQQTNL